MRANCGKGALSRGPFCELGGVCVAGGLAIGDTRISKNPSKIDKSVTLSLMLPSIVRRAVGGVGSLELVKIRGT